MTIAAMIKCLLLAMLLQHCYQAVAAIPLQLLSAGLADHREATQQNDRQLRKPLAAAARADSPVRGIEALQSALPRQGREGAAVRIQRWYRLRQAERKVRPSCPVSAQAACICHNFRGFTAVA